MNRLVQELERVVQSSSDLIKIIIKFIILLEMEKIEGYDISYKKNSYQPLYCMNYSISRYFV